MENLKIFFPSSILQPYIRQYWFLSLGEVNSSQRAIPSGCMGLVFNRGNKIYTSAMEILPKAYLFGQAIKPIDMYFYGLDLIIIVFHPFGAKAFFDFPMNEIIESNLGFDLLNKPSLMVLEERLYGLDDNRCIAYIEDFLIRNLSNTNDINLKRMFSAFRLIESGENNVSHISNQVCLSYKQFCRIFLSYIGAKAVYRNEALCRMFDGHISHALAEMKNMVEDIISEGDNFRMDIPYLKGLYNSLK